jgi:hypothetical protein
MQVGYSGELKRCVENVAKLHAGQIRPADFGLLMRRVEAQVSTPDLWGKTAVIRQLELLRIEWDERIKEGNFTV